MKQLTLDFSKWRAGGSAAYDNGNQIGKGRTSLCNSFGFMCCLGQFAVQSGFTSEEIYHFDEPCQLPREFDIFNTKTEHMGFVNTNIAQILMDVNDDHKTTWQQKVLRIHSELKDKGIKLIVINTPEPINLPE